MYYFFAHCVLNRSNLFTSIGYDKTDLLKLSLYASRRLLLRGWAKTIYFHPAGFQEAHLRARPPFSKNPFTTSFSLRWPLGQEFTGSNDEALAGQMHNTADVPDANSFVRSGLGRNMPIPKSEDPRRVHMLGAGNTGRFVAHSIAGIPDRPPITMIFRSVKMLRKWTKGGQSIEVVTDGYGETRYNFDTEVLPPAGTPSPLDSTEPRLIDPASSIVEQSDSTAAAEQLSSSFTSSEPIHQLIVSVKAPFVVRALSRVAHRLSRDSTILFFYDGMGLLEEVNRNVFPDESTRPTYISGLISHHLEGSSPDSFAVIHAGMGTVALGISPRHSMFESWSKADGISWLSPSARYLIRTLTRTPVLAAVGFSPTEMVQLQIEKLAVKAIISPLTVVFDCCNGELLHNMSITRVKRLLLAEISLVARSLPELQGVPNVTLRFSPERLESLVVNVCIDTNANITPMLKLVRAAKLTDIEYLNGYIVRRGEDIGIKCLINYMVLQIVKGKGILHAHRNSVMVPIQQAI